MRSLDSPLPAADYELLLRAILVIGRPRIDARVDLNKSITSVWVISDHSGFGFEGIDPEVFWRTTRSSHAILAGCTAMMKIKTLTITL